MWSKRNAQSKTARRSLEREREKRCIWVWERERVKSAACSLKLPLQLKYMMKNNRVDNPSGCLKHTQLVQISTSYEYHLYSRRDLGSITRRKVKVITRSADFACEYFQLDLAGRFWLCLLCEKCLYLLESFQSRNFCNIQAIFYGLIIAKYS